MLGYSPLAADPLSSLPAGGSTGRLICVGSATPSFISNAFAYSPAVIAGVSAATFVTDLRAFVLAGATNLSPKIEGRIKTSSLIEASTDVSGLRVWSEIRGTCSVSGVASLQGSGMSFTYFGPKIKAASIFDPLISYNKNLRFNIGGISSFSGVSDGIARTTVAISGNAIVHFDAKPTDALIRMSLPGDRIVARRFNISGKSLFSASTNIPGEQAFAISGRSKVDFRSLVQKVRTAKFLSKSVTKAKLRGAYG